MVVSEASSTTAAQQQAPAQQQSSAQDAASDHKHASEKYGKNVHNDSEKFRSELTGKGKHGQAEELPQNLEEKAALLKHDAEDSADTLTEDKQLADTEQKDTDVSDLPVDKQILQPAVQESTSPFSVAGAQTVAGPDTAARAELAEQMRVATERVLASSDGKEIRVELKNSVLEGTSFTVTTDSDGTMIFNFDTTSAKSAQFLETNADNIKQALLEQAGAAAEVKVSRRGEDSGQGGDQQQQQQQQDQPADQEYSPF